MVEIQYNYNYSIFRNNFTSKRLDNLFHKRILKSLDVKKEDRILEIGCNTGDFLQKLQPICKQAVGIDINESALKLNPVKTTYKMSGEKLKFKNCSF